jgi:hypothetical protein
MDITLKEYTDSLKIFGDSVEAYLNEINNYDFSGTYPLEFEKVLDFLKSVRKSSKIDHSKKLLGKNVSLEDLFSFVSDVALTKNDMIGILSVLKNSEFGEDRQHSSSSSGKLFTYEIIIGFMNSLNDLVNAEAQIMPEHKLLQIIKTAVSNMDIKNSNDIHKLYKEYDKKGIGYTIMLPYTFIVQQIIDGITVDKKLTQAEATAKIREHILRIETLKTEALAHPTIVGTANRNINTVQKFIQRFNLIPNGDCVSLDDIFKQLGQKKSTFQILANNLSKSLGSPVGVIVVRKISPQPMEHKVAPLIDRAYLDERKLFQDGQVGINKNIYIRTNTITPLPLPLDVSKGKGAGTSKDVVESYFSGKTEEGELYVLETLDDKTYRFLHLWELESKKMSVPSTWIKLIAQKETTPSNRMYYYNDIINAAIIERLHEPYIKMDIMNSDKAAKSKTKWNNVKTNIIKELSGKYTTSGDKYGKLFSDPKFLGDVISLIAQKLSNLDKITNDIAIREISISYAKDLEAINKKLERELKNTYDGRTSKSTFATIMDEVLSKFINNKSNLQTTIEYKSKLLNTVLKFRDGDDSDGSDGSDDSDGGESY